MPYCKNDPKKTYKGNEPSPKGLGYCAHTEKEGIKKKGNDGNMWEVKKVKNGSKRWIKINDNNLTGYKKYYTHYNGGRPFLVKIKNNNVIVYKLNYDKVYNYKNNDDNVFDKFKTFNAKKIFIGKDEGKSTYSDLSGMSKIDAIKFSTGNSILLHLSKNKYVFIGHDLIEFTTNNDIIKNFYSIIGRNDVPYPFAIGDKYIYGFVVPFGYISKKEYSKLDIDYINNKAIEFDPFYYSFKTHKPKQNLISLDNYKTIQKQNIDEISLKTARGLCKIYNVVCKKTKQEIFDTIEKVRGIIPYDKKTKENNKNKKKPNKTKSFLSYIF